jgi:hypothetical protein
MCQSTGKVFGMTNPIEPVTIPTVSRPARIAALHAAGLWLAEHTDVPMPDAVSMVRYDVTLEQLRALSQLHNEPIQYGGTSQWVEIPVTIEVLHGVEITYTAFGPKIPETTPMDLPPRGQGVTTDPWADVMPTARCSASIDLGRGQRAQCVKTAGHDDPCFYDNDNPVAL